MLCTRLVVSHIDVLQDAHRRTRGGRRRRAHRHRAAATRRGACRCLCKNTVIRRYNSVVFCAQDNLNISSEVARTSNQQQNLTVAFAFVKQRRHAEANGDAPLVPRCDASTSHFIGTRAEDLQQFASRFASYLAGNAARVGDDAMVRMRCDIACVVNRRSCSATTRGVCKPACRADGSARRCARCSRQRLTKHRCSS